MGKIEFDEIEIISADIERTTQAISAAIACGGASPQTVDEPSFRRLMQGAQGSD
jgi:hypothetical protein